MGCVGWVLVWASMRVVEVSTYMVTGAVSNDGEGPQHYSACALSSFPLFPLTPPSPPSPPLPLSPSPPLPLFSPLTRIHICARRFTPRNRTRLTPSLCQVVDWYEGVYQQSWVNGMNDSQRSLGRKVRVNIDNFIQVHMGAWVTGWVDGWMGGWMGGWVGGVGGWMDGWMGRQR